MKNASSALSSEQKESIEQAVRNAENRTATEIVPVLATASGRYDRPEDVVGLWLAGIGIVVTWFLLPTVEQPDATGDWGGWPGWANLLILLVVLVVGFVVGAIVGSKISWLRRLFTPRQEMVDEVADHAATVFATRGIYRTAGATGLLLYVSLYERRAVVLGDERVLETVGQPFLDELRDAMVSKLRAGDLAAAYTSTIDKAADRLADALPVADDDRDELPGELVILD
jgi:putative membrane protein